MNVEPYNFVSALNCVMAQRLVRKICPACKTPTTYSEDVLKESNIDPTLIKGKELYEGKGCVECNGTGYRGRMAIAEVLELSDKIRELIIAKRPGSEIKKQREKREWYL